MVRQKKNNRVGNRGSSLIEIIVSVLIVGIVFVPLLTGIGVAVKINRKAENKLCAENAATNIMETTKALGLKEGSGLKNIYSSATHVALNSIPNYDATLLSGITGFDQGATRISGTIESPMNFGAYLTGAYLGKVNYDSSVANAPTMQYYLANVKQGTHEYYSVVTIDTKKYSAQNDSTQYQGIGNIAGGKTGQVNVGTAVERDELSALCTKVNGKNGTNFTTDNIAALIKDRTIEITIEKDTDNTSPNVGKHVVSCEYVYTLNNKWEDVVSNTGNKAFTDGSSNIDFSKRIFDESKGDSYTYRSGTKYVAAYAATPEVLMLYASTLTDTLTLNDNSDGSFSSLDGVNPIISRKPTEGIKIIKNDQPSMDIYILMAGVDISEPDTTYMGAKLNVTIQKGTGVSIENDNIEIYSKLPLNGTNFAKLNDLISAAKDDQYSKIYDITVDVYDILGDLIITKTSTVYE